MSDEACTCGCSTAVTNDDACACDCRPTKADTTDGRETTEATR